MPSQANLAAFVSNVNRRRRPKAPPEGYEYQTDEDGFYVLDLNGKRVLIPIEE